MVDDEDEIEVVNEPRKRSEMDEVDDEDVVAMEEEKVVDTMTVENDEAVDIDKNDGVYEKNED